MHLCTDPAGFESQKFPGLVEVLCPSFGIRVLYGHFAHDMVLSALSALLLLAESLAGERSPASRYSLLRGEA